MSTAVGERGLSTISVIATKSGNRLHVKTISTMFFLSLVRPPQAKFEPAKHVREWLDCRRNGDDMRGRKVVECIIIIMIIVLPPVKCSMPDTADGDAISRCEVLSRAGSVHHGADQ